VVAVLTMGCMRQQSKVTRPMMRGKDDGGSCLMWQRLGHREARITAAMGEVRHRGALSPICRAGGGGRRLVGGSSADNP
jgi:hypothetical protein